MNEGHAIRVAIDSDCAAVSHCAEAAYQLYIKRIGKPPAPMIADFATLIAERKVKVLLERRQLVGYVVSFPVDAIQAQGDLHQSQQSLVYFLENIAVLPGKQGIGYGKLLVDEAIALAGKSGCDCIELYTNEKMVENIDWYRKLGFVEFERKLQDGFNRVYFRLDLQVQS